jgi:hypothetical protein
MLNISHNPDYPEQTLSVIPDYFTCRYSIKIISQQP